MEHGSDQNSDGFKKSVRAQHVEKFSIQSGSATPATAKKEPRTVSRLGRWRKILGGCGGGDTGRGDEGEILNHDGMLNLSTFRVLMDFLGPSVLFKGLFFTLKMDPDPGRILQRHRNGPSVLVLVLLVVFALFAAPF